MKILLVTNKPIYPKFDGGCVAMDNFLQCLQKEKVEIKHLTLSTEKHPFVIDNYPTHLQKEIQPESIKIATEVNPLNAFINLFKRGSYNVNRFHSEEMLQLISRKLSDESFDAIILESLYSTTYLKEIKKSFKGKIYVRIHNIESDLWDKYARDEKNFIKRIYIQKLAKDIRKYEINTLNEADGIMAISLDDKNSLKELGITTNAITIPVAISLNQVTVNDYNQNNLFHVGAMNWQPNIEAVERLVKLFPPILHKHPATHLHIAGANCPSSIFSKNTKNIHNEGFVDDITVFAKQTGILVTPIISGSGVRIKILEMMALGIPVITTSLGALGINYKGSNCIRIAETDQEIILATLELIENKQSREEIGKNAIDYIQKNHSIEKISKKLIEYIQPK